MKKHLFQALAICLLGFLTTSCGDDEDTDNIIPSDCTNLTGWVVSGHQWVYDHYSDYIFADSLTVTVAAEIGNGVFRVNSVYDDGFIYPAYTTYMKPCKNDIYSSSSENMADAFVAYKVDGEVGESWNYTGKTQAGYTATVQQEITGKNISVTVPAGTFSCLKLHQVMNSSQPGSLTVISDIYLNNQYGLIKLDGNTTEYQLRRKNY